MANIRGDLQLALRRRVHLPCSLHSDLSSFPPLFAIFCLFRTRAPAAGPADGAARRGVGGKTATARRTESAPAAPPTSLPFRYCVHRLSEIRPPLPHTPPRAALLHLAPTAAIWVAQTLYTVALIDLMGVCGERNVPAVSTAASSDVRAAAAPSPPPPLLSPPNKLRPTLPRRCRCAQQTKIVQRSGGRTLRAPLRSRHE